MKDITKKYNNGEITIVWKPGECIHSGICFRGLNSVFDPKKRPWITPEQASSQEIINQIDKCPSGALSYYKNDKTANQETNIEAETIIETVVDGPLLVFGNVVIKNKEGELTHKHNVTAFCRCGASANKPYCDGSHQKIGFKG
jgi:uncharacterized Fe-S cluster protein YjdI